MKTDQVAAWLGSFMDIGLMLIDDAAVALTTINSTPAACTVGFSQVDTGLVIDGDGATDVRCEIVTVGGVVDKQLPGRAVVAAARAIERLGIPAQPGVLLEGALDELGTTATRTLRPRHTAIPRTRQAHPAARTRRPHRRRIRHRPQPRPRRPNPQATTPRHQHHRMESRGRVR